MRWWNFERAAERLAVRGSTKHNCACDHLVWNFNDDWMVCRWMQCNVQYLWIYSSIVACLRWSQFADWERSNPLVTSSFDLWYVCVQVQIYGPPNWAATLSKYVLCSKHKNEMLQEAVEQRCCEIRNMDWTQTISNSAWRPTKENLAHVIESEF